MSSTHSRAARLALLAPALATLAVAVTGSAAGADHHKSSERFVVRGVDTVVDGGDCPGGVCRLALTDGAFRGTVGTGAYTGAIKLKVAEGYQNGEGGVCAPIAGGIELGAGTPDRLVLMLRGDSCQDGAGPVTAASFTGLVQFTIAKGTGKYAHARGSGIGSFAEDAADREQMTLIGRIAR